MIRKSLQIYFLITGSIFACLLITSCKNEIGEGTIIFTKKSGESTQLAALNPANKTIQILTTDFSTALSPSLSCDGKTLVFSGKIKMEDPTQIFIMDLNKRKITQVTKSDSNCYSPAILPGGKIIFSIQNGSVLSIYVCNPDGSELNKITFDPYSYISHTVLQDGRILSHRAEESDGDKSMMIVLRPDGTKAEIFYNSTAGSILRSTGVESESGRIFFIESSSALQETGQVISIDYRIPLHTYMKISDETIGTFRSVYPEKSGKLIVSCKKSGSEKFELYELDPDSKSLSGLYQDAESDLYDPVIVEARTKPKKLPSEVDKGVKTGLLLCQDINFHDTSFNKIIADKIEIMGVDSILGIVKAEPDGSVYLKVIADTPFRLRTIDKNGNQVQGPGSWIYLRPNERRGCVGCHEDPELVPENKLALSVKKSPVNIPMHVSNVKEKEISLE